MSKRKNPAQFIRKDVFGCKSQHEFGELLGYPQPVISRFETSVRPLSREAQERIRAAAKARRIVWDNDWFFEVPRDFQRPQSRAA